MEVSVTNLGNKVLMVPGDLALAIALVSRWVCAAMACAKCVGQVEAQSS